MNCLTHKLLPVIIVFLGLVCGAFAESHGVCSFHQGATCHKYAECEETTDGNFTCTCQTNYYGDGFKNGTGCTSERHPCFEDTDCHSMGECKDKFCACKPGFKGDGYDSCDDIDECVNKPCNEDASCQNNLGGYNCTCNFNFRGDGFECAYFCSVNADCHDNGICKNEDCICKTGYEGDGRFNCTDINECNLMPVPCSIYAECTNTEGGHTCECKNGYVGNGLRCEALPRTCDEILQKDPSSKDGTYTIDADGPDDLPSMEVYCDMMGDMGVTIMEPVGSPLYITRYVPEHTMDYKQTIPQILKVANNSGFCFQYMGAVCQYKAVMLSGDDFWIDGQDRMQYNWGGAKTTGKCVCGQIGSCATQTSNCNCDGSASGRKDDGKIIDKELLPIKKIYIGGLIGYQKMAITLGPVTCGPKPFGFPVDCDEAKFDRRYNIKKNGPQIIDIDGPDGSANPILVQCDMETYPHVGVSVIFHDRTKPTIPTDMPTSVEYAGNMDTIDKIIQESVFCRQDVLYDCVNSPIMKNGNTKFTDTADRLKDYWPGGLPGRCACGLTGTCADPNMECNCDLEDGVRRQDLGIVTNKGDLPVGSVVSNNAGDNSTYTIGPLMCSRQEFGYEANCDMYFRKGTEMSYTYMIDPDGPPPRNVVDLENVPPFPATCIMIKEPPHGVTIIHHEKETYLTLSGDFILRYYYVSAAQFVKLRKRSVFCTQAISFTCTGTPLFTDGDAQVQWYDIEGNAHAYFNGKGTNGCACAENKNCAGGISSLCNCDRNDTQTRDDVGNLINKDDLPIERINGNGPSVTVGPLQCYDTYPTCSDLYWYMRGHRLPSENMMKDDVYTINPDGPGGVESFKVICKFPQTEIPLIPGGRTNHTDKTPDEGNLTKCFDITYNYGISSEQVQALVDRSTTCTQELLYHCNNAPLIDHIHYKTCDGKQQPGWAGSNGIDQCACGVTGVCDSKNEEVNDCSCQVQDGKKHSDGGWIRDKDQLPVCQVCMTLDAVTADIPSRSASYEISSLYCSNSNIGIFGSCQSRRDSTTQNLPSSTVSIDPDGFNTGNPPFPIFCEMLAHPPAGITRVYANPDDKPVPKEGGKITVKYYVYEFDYIKVVVERAVFCEQEIYILCNGTERPQNRGDYDDWVVTGDGAVACKPGACSCDDGLIHGGFVKEGLPVQSINLDSSSADRELYIGPLACYDLYKDCHDIKVHGANIAWFRGHIYAIDPDQAGGVEYFAVKCDFETDRNIGITIVYGSPNSIKVEGQKEPGKQTTFMVYPDATPEQINVLTKQSGFCSQGIQYECKETGLLNNNNPDGYYTTYGGVQSTSFGTGFQSDVEGCACVMLGTCPEGKSCHCDAKGPMVSFDYGIVTDRNVLPITQLHLGGQTATNAAATATVGDVRCGPTPFDLPKDCEDVHNQGYKSGEFMIWPSTDVTPYMVYCDMELVPGHGITVIGHDHEDPKPIKEPGTKEVTYKSATDKQVEELTEISKYCYQPIKYDCFNTHFLGYGKFYWTGSGGLKKYYLGTGKNQQCSCANDYRTCGGDQTKAVLKTRKCSCDAGELQMRADAGILSNARDLPVLSMTFLNGGRTNESGTITLGKLYCAQVEFDINECDTDFHDCHEKADCVNKPGTFGCVCQPGWQGKGLSGVWANGRNCYDDNECAINSCPYSSTCENIPGSFICHCHEGYTKTGPTTCDDNNECELKTDNCDENAVCTNIPGSFHCRCKRGFRGNGTSCTPLGICTCFGDPHCISYDQKILHFQGDCQYVMSQDGCDGSPQTFQVLTKHSNRNIPGITDATWIEKVTVKSPYYVVILDQGNVVFVDGLKRNLPVYSDHMMIRKRGGWIEMFTSNHIQINWDGDENVEVNVPPTYQRKLCGLCGNYNNRPGDDWKVGPACAGEGAITTNANRFGHSYVDIIYRDANPQCTFDCNEKPPPSEPCTGTDKLIAEYECGKIFDMNGKFKTCLVLLEVTMYENMFESCLFDACKVKDDKGVMICKAAENLVKECSENYATEFVDWRTDEMCSPNCDVGKEYKSCGTEENTRSCYNKTTDITETDSICRPGCYCKSGLIMDGDNCIEPERCGCLYNDFYYSVGQTYVDENCTAIYTCQSDRTFKSRPLSCNENATCSNKEGVYGCHCKHGFMGNGEECEFNPCGSDPCNPDEFCVVKGDSYLCECRMGYQGDCNNCEDIDECATRTHDCPPHSRCHNTPGSFRCECIDGYTTHNKRCEDINECKIGMAKCADGTKCFNIPGSYHCEPCSANSPSNKCCACHGGKCTKPGQVCGTNGKTYQSEADLIIDRCESGKKIHVDYSGTCQDSCPSEKLCPKWQNCEVSEATGAPSCGCQPCTESERNSTVKVCSNKLDLYENMCAFKRIQCALDREDIPIVNTTSPCTEKKGEDIVTEWSPWSPCTVTCGNGTMARTRNAVVEFDEYLEEKYELEATSNCYMPPCAGSACESAGCNISQVCVEGESGDALCTCPDCTDHGDDPVCGKIRNQYTRTYENPCELSKAACEEGEPYEQLYFGKCGTEPVNCTVMPVFRSHRNDAGCFSSGKINIGRCAGGCGAYTNKCCKAITSRVDVPLTCGDQSDALKKVDVIDRCECVTLPK